MSIEITMLGTSGAGKTCCLCAMASKMSIGVKGYTFFPKDYEVGLELGEKWAGILKGKTPVQEDGLGTQPYQFVCSHAFKPLSDFSLCDYNGGVLTADGSGLNKECQDFVCQKVKLSSGIIICISAEHVHELKSLSLQSIRVLNAYQTLLEKIGYVAKESGKQIPIVFAITKADLLKESEYREAVECLRGNFFTELFDLDAGWRVGFVPVSIGKGLQIDGGEIVGGYINPWNVEIPVLLCIRSFLEDQCDVVSCQIGEVENEKQVLEHALRDEQNKSWWERPLIGGDDCGIYERAIREREEALSGLLEKRAPIQHDIDELTNIIDESGATIYRNGRCATDFHKETSV